MAHHCDYSEEVKVIRNKVYRIVTATYKNKRLDVFKESLDGRYYFRPNLRFSYMTGYLVAFPQEKASRYYWDKNIMEKEKYCETSENANLFATYPELRDYKHLIIKQYPKLKYFVTKLSNYFTPHQVFELCRLYEKHPEIEYLAPYRQYSLMTSKMLFKLTKNKQKQVLDFVRKNIQCDEMTLANIFTCMKHNLKYQQLGIVGSAIGKEDTKTVNYLLKHNLDFSTYSDYRKMCQELNHNFTNDYWRYPSDFFAQNHKVLNEYSELKKLEEEKKYLEIDVVLGKLANKFNHDFEFNGYQAYIPSNTKLIKKVAKELHQCLITSLYHKKMAQGKSLLIFIKKENDHIATAEIDYEKKIIQFYGNERDRRTCIPPKEVHDVLDAYLDNTSIYKPRINYCKGA